MQSRCMSTTTDMLAVYLAAEMAILGGQSYKWGDRQLNRADLAQVIAGRKEWERKAAAEARGGIGVQYASFDDATDDRRDCCWGRNA